MQGGRYTARKPPAAHPQPGQALLIHPCTPSPESAMEWEPSAAPHGTGLEPNKSLCIPPERFSSTCPFHQWRNRERKWNVQCHRTRGSLGEIRHNCVSCPLSAASPVHLPACCQLDMASHWTQAPGTSAHSPTLPRFPSASKAAPVSGHSAMGQGPCLLVRCFPGSGGAQERRG